MKRLAILTLAIGALCSCNWLGIRGNGHIITDQRSVTDFTELKASGGFIIEWRSGAPSVSIQTDDNLLQYIDVGVSDSKLQIRTRERLHPTRHIVVTITSQQLNGADLRGAVDLAAHHLAGPKFYVRAAGASEITVDGTVDELLSDMTGAGDLRAKSLVTKTAEISTTGAGDAVVNVSDTLRVSITGAGDVVYYGNPKNIEKHITGAGSVTHKE